MNNQNRHRSFRAPSFSSREVIAVVPKVFVPKDRAGAMVLDGPRKRYSFHEYKLHH